MSLAGFSTQGRDLAYVGGLVVTPIESINVPLVDLPRVAMALDRDDGQILVDRRNLAGEARRSFVSPLRPRVSIPFDGLSLSDVELLRALHQLTTDFFFVRIMGKEQIRAMGSIIFQDPIGTFKVRIPPNSYTAASRRIVAATGASTLSEFFVLKNAANWYLAATDTALPSANAFLSYDEPTETITLDPGGGPYTDGDRAWISFRASGFMARAAPGPSWTKHAGGLGVYAGGITFEGA